MDQGLTNMPSQLADLLSHLTQPSVYTEKFSRLFSSLPQLLSSQFSHRLASLLTSVHTSLPSRLTSPPLPNDDRDDFILPPYFTDFVIKFTSTVTVILGIVPTIVTLTTPSKRLSDLCSRCLITLHTALYVNVPSDLNLCELLFRMNDVLIAPPEVAPYSALTSFPVQLFSTLRNILPHKIYFKYTLSEELNEVLDYLVSEMYYDTLYLIEELNTEMLEALQYIPDVPYCDVNGFTVPYVYQTRGDTDNCYICLEEISDGDNARRLCCFHNYHLECIDRCLKTKSSCQQCRTPINTTHN